MRCYLVRHAVTAETGLRLSGRIEGIALSDEGRAMAEAVASELSGVRLAAVYTSPIQRCRETASIVAAAHGLEWRSDDRLTEVDFGTWSGRTLKSLHRLAAWRRLLAFPSRFAFPDGESLRTAQQRSIDAIEELAGRHRREAIAVVAHSDVIRLTIAHYLAMPLDALHRLEIAPASVSVLDLAAEGPPRIPIVNRRCGALQ